MTKIWFLVGSEDHRCEAQIVVINCREAAQSVSGGNDFRLLKQVESYLSILLLDHDVKIIFPGSKQSLEFREISVLWSQIK